MTEDREKRIRERWAQGRERAMQSLGRHGDTYTMLLDLPAVPVGVGVPPIVDAIEMIVFTLEHGWEDGQVMSRVLCEGIEIERWRQ